MVWRVVYQLFPPASAFTPRKPTMDLVPTCKGRASGFQGCGIGRNTQARLCRPLSNSTLLSLVSDVYFSCIKLSIATRAAFFKKLNSIQSSKLHISSARQGNSNRIEVTVENSIVIQSPQPAILTCLCHADRAFVTQGNSDSYTRGAEKKQTNENTGNAKSVLSYGHFPGRASCYT
jgi:hypothetical protein